MQASARPSNAACFGALSAVAQFERSNPLPANEPKSGKIQTTRSIPRLRVGAGGLVVGRLPTDASLDSKEYPQSHADAEGGFSRLQSGHFMAVMVNTAVVQAQGPRIGSELVAVLRRQRFQRGLSKLGCFSLDTLERSRVTVIGRFAEANSRWSEALMRITAGLRGAWCNSFARYPAFTACRHAHFPFAKSDVEDFHRPAGADQY